MVRQPKRRRGRPPAEDRMVQIAIRLPSVVLDYVDEQLQGRLDGKDRSSFIRELLAEAIEARRRSSRAR